MKILIYSWKDIKHPLAGGAELNIFKHAKNWIKAGHEVTMFTSHFKGARKFEQESNLRIYRKGGKFTVYFWAIIFYFLKFRAEKFDFLIDIENGIPFFTPFYSRLPKILYIHHIHFKQHFTYFKFPLNVWGYFLERYLLPFAYKKAKFVTVSESSKNDMHKYKLTKRSVSIIYNGVDTSTYKPSKQKFKKPTVLYLGRLAEYKRIDLIIRAIAIVQKKLPKAQLLIAGRGREEEYLKKLVKALALENIVKFQGFVSERQKVELYAKSHIFVAFSRWEGWGVTSLEAQACGTPAIVADVKGLRETVMHNKTGIICENNSIKVLAKNITDLLTDKEKYRKLRTNAISFAKNFSWKESSEKFLKEIVSEFRKSSKKELYLLNCLFKNSKNKFFERT